jgi:hypothetical protein
MGILRVLVSFALVVAGVVSTVGSGGGGGGGNWAPLYWSTPPDIPTPDIPPRDIAWVDITIANAQDVSATVVRAADQVFDVATAIGGQIFPSPPAAPDLLSSNSKFELFATVAMTGAPVTEPCAMGGTVTVSGGYAGNDPVSLSERDVFYLVFDTCDDGDGYTLDGSFSLFVSELVGDPRTDVFRLSYALRDMTLTVASGMDNYAASAGFSFLLGWDSLAFPVIVLTPTPGALQLSSQADVYSWSYGGQSLTVNADISISTTLGEARESLMESAFLGGYISYEIIVPLQAPDGQDPESGEILVSEGVGNGTIRIVIESSTIVRLDIDPDGDGTVDDIQFTTWAALQG